MILFFFWKWTFMLLNVLNLVEVLAHLKSWNITSDTSSCIISERHEDNKKVHFGIFFFFFFYGNTKDGPWILNRKNNKEGKEHKTWDFCLPSALQSGVGEIKADSQEDKQCVKSMEIFPTKKKEADFIVRAQPPDRYNIQNKSFFISLVPGAVTLKIIRIT